MKSLKLVFYIISSLMLFSCERDIYKGMHQLSWKRISKDSAPKSTLLAYINQEPTFSDVFPDTIKLKSDYSGYVSYGHYKWVKIPVQVIEYKFNKAELDEQNKFDLDLPQGIPKEISPKHGGVFSLKSFKYVIYPYCNKNFKKKLLKTYNKKKLIYIINPKLLNDKSGYYGALTSTILEEDLKYSSQFYSYPWRIEY